MYGKHRTMIVLVALGVVARSGAFTLEPDRKAAVDTIISALLTSRYEQAFAMVDSFDRATGEDPVGPMIRLFAMGLRDLDLEHTADPSGFERAYLATLEAAENYETRHGRSSYSLTVAGYACATWSSYNLREKKYFTAVQVGWDALAALEEADDLDESNYDDDFFLGMYDCAKAELKKRLWWILFWYPGDKAQGIRRLEACSRDGQFSSVAAKLALVDIYSDMQRSDDAERVLSELKTTFPGSRFVLWGEAKHHERCKRFAEAGETFGLLADSYAAVPGGRYNEIVTRKRQAQALIEAGLRERAAEVCRTAISACADPQGMPVKGECGDVEKMMRGLERRD
jgi:hypothetical protein